MKRLFLSSAILCSLTLPIANAKTANLNLNYDFNLPLYQSAGNFIIENHSGMDVQISKIEFDSNFLIVGNPWGTLWNYSSNIIMQPNSDHVTYHYTIEEKPTPITVRDHAQLTFALQPPTAPLPIPLNPQHVQVTIEKQSYNLAIKGMCEGKACNDPTPGLRILGYYSDWDPYQIQYFPEQIPVKKINTIHYSFMNYDKDGNVFPYDKDQDTVQIPKIAKLRQQYPYLNASLSFGGWTLSYNFSAMANNPTALNNFVNNAVAAMKQIQFNGIDIDWEYPTFDNTGDRDKPVYPYDAANFAQLLTLLREKLDVVAKQDEAQSGKPTHYFLTIAAPAGIDKINAIQNADPTAWKKITKAIDFVDVMTYDFHGGWDKNAPGNFMSAMALDPNNDVSTKDPRLKTYNVKDAVQAYLSLGFKPAQIIVGIPLYGRLSNVDKAGNSMGLYQTVLGTADGEYVDPRDPKPTGMFDYNCIVDIKNCKGQGAEKIAGIQLINQAQYPALFNQYAYFSKTPWGFMPGKNQFLTYDDVDSTRYKANWVLQKQFAGVMFWEFSGDVNADHPKSLVNAVYQVFKNQNNK